MLYRLSGFVYPFSDGRTHLLRSTLTGMTVSLSETEWALVERASRQLVSGLELLENGLGELAENVFLVENSTSDYQQYMHVINILKLLKHEFPGTKTYTILPTTGCNARCVYCYEEGMPIHSMSEETADHVVAFIDETRWKDKIKLIWFGGEPLAGSGIISRICKGLKERDIPFRSKIITNGTLFTHELLEEAVSLWHLETVQVSVDGARRDYEARKRYVNPTVHHYDTMMDAVGRMLDKGIKVTLRCNYDADNLGGLKDFIDDLDSRFGSPENLSFYPALLFQEQAKESGIGLYRKAQELIDLVQERGLGGKNAKPFQLKLNYCAADSGDKGLTIAPDGRLYHCEHLPDNTSFGSVFDPAPVICSDKRAEFPACKECRTCCFLPECTPFYKNGCPDCSVNCRAFREIKAAADMRRLIRKGEVNI